MDDDVLRLILVRHGATEWNDEHRIIGSTDLPLGETGRRQAAQLAERLAGEPLRAIYSSDLKRAAETAETIAGRSGQAVRYDARLREMDFGQWEGMTVPEVEAQQPGALERWKRDLAESPPSGERSLEVQRRIEAFCADLTRAASSPGAAERRAGNGAVVIVSHGVALQVLVFALMGFPYRNDWSFYMYNGSVSELWVTPERTVMVYLNDTHHLSPG
jgi:broad specificity phosphatase PhoE